MAIAFRIALISLIITSALAADVSSVLPKVYQTYKQIHLYPELGNKEYGTSRLIDTELRAAGYTEFVDSPSLETEVITVLRTGRPGPTICLRAELDALDLPEKTNLEFASKIDGRMHACGHDAHAAMLLGAAIALKADTTVNGTIVFLFQPAEEVRGGADDIIKDSTLQKLGVEKVFGQHVFPGLAAGIIRIAPGPVLAGSNYFTVTVNGRGSHAAFPHQGDDVPTCLANIISGVTGLPARKMNVLEEPCIMSVAWIECDTSQVFNALPQEASFGGTVRAYMGITDSLQNGGTIESVMTDYITNTAEAYGCTAEFKLRKGAPPTTNDPALTAAILRDAQEFPALHADGESIKRMTAEDFSYYTEVFPCLYFSLGIAKDGLGEVGLHQSEFTIHPDALHYGTEFMVWLAHWGTRTK